MPTSELPYGAIKVLTALVGVAGAGSLIMWLGSSESSIIRSWEIVRANQKDAISRKHLDNAEAAARQEVRLSERLGSSNYRVAISHDDLGQILFSEKKNEEALKHFDDAEKIFSTNVSRARDQTSKRMLLSDLSASQANFARTLIEEGKIDEGAKLFCSAISNLQACLQDPGSGRLDLYIAHRQVDLLLQLAKIRLNLGQKAEAVKLFGRALSIADESFYPAFLLGAPKKTFSALLKEGGDDQEAETLFSYDRFVQHFNKAEQARQKAEDADYARELREAADAAKTAKSTMHLAVVCLKKLAKLQIQQNPALSRQTCIEALQIWKTLGGGADSEADYIMGLLTRLAQNKDEAIDMQSSRLKLRRDLYGLNDYHVAETATELASLYSDKGDLKTAMLYANEAYDTFSQLRIKKRGIGLQEASLGKVFEQASQYAKAEQMYKRTIAAQMMGKKKNPNILSEAYTHLSQVYNHQGKPVESQKASMEAQRWRSSLVN